MIPKRIHSSFSTTEEKKDGENILIEGKLTCCNSYSFEIHVVGDIKRVPFNGMYLYPKGDKIAIEACCEDCGSNILVFDSDQDGYDRCNEIIERHFGLEQVKCKRCHNSFFSVEIRYEYPDFQELIDLGITEPDDAFTWIWISLECKTCGKKYKNFIDCETG